MKRLYIRVAIFLSLLATNADLRADALTFTATRAGFNDLANWPGTCSANVPSVSTVSSKGVSVTAQGLSGNITSTQQLDPLADPSDPSTGNPGCPLLDSGGNILAYSFGGNFNINDGLVLSTPGFDANGDLLGTGPIELTLNQGVSGIGTQFQEIGFGSFVADLV